MRKPKVVSVTAEELEGLKQRAQSKQLLDSDYELLARVTETLLAIRGLLDRARVSVRRLKRLLFGPSTEKSCALERTATHREAAILDAAGKRKGHGRTPTSAYWGAQRVEVSHESLKAGDRCPSCAKANLYDLQQPARLVRFVAKAPVAATVHDCQRLRCALCGEVFTAIPPEEARGAKYDESVGSMLSVLHYGAGMPFYRLEQLQRSLGVPLPSSVQWKLVLEKAAAIHPVYEELFRLASQAEILQTDDTHFTVLELLRSRRSALLLEEAEGGKKARKVRTGSFTTGILARLGALKIALYRTGARHAGENLSELLARRPQAQPPPILMCDALSANLPKGYEVLLANCIAHGRRGFVDLVEAFPRECGCVLETFRVLYGIDERAHREGLSAQERLELHQRLSASLLAGLHDWLEAQFEKKKVEPNSSMGGAIKYLLKHWQALTLFLRVPGAPLDNNLAEQVLKRAILSRKNSLFYKTLNGATVGDRLMAVSHTCVLNKVNPFDYLTAVHTHASKVAESPADWLPWSYQAQLAKTTATASSR